MSFPKEGGGSGDGGSGVGATGNGLSLYLEADAVMDAGGLFPVPFTGIAWNEGLLYNDSNGEIRILEGGRIILSAIVGAVPQNSTFAIAAILHKNGLPVKQHASNNGVSPYCTAPLTYIGNVVAGDKFILYSTAAGNIDQEYTLHASDGVTGLDLSYL